MIRQLEAMIKNYFSVVMEVHNEIIDSVRRALTSETIRKLEG